MRDFLKLGMWQQSHALTLQIYAITNSFPKEEMYGLASQMRRSASSIPTNIAEGCGRNSSTQILYFFQIAAGSCSELLYQLILIKDLSYIAEPNFKELYIKVNQIQKMIYSYSEAISSSIS